MADQNNDEKIIRYVYPNDFRSGEAMYMYVGGVIDIDRNVNNREVHYITLKDGTKRRISPGWIDAQILGEHGGNGYGQ